MIFQPLLTYGSVTILQKRYEHPINFTYRKLVIYIACCKLFRSTGRCPSPGPHRTQLRDDIRVVCTITSASLSINNFMSSQGVSSAQERVPGLLLFKTSINNLDDKIKRLSAGHQNLCKDMEHWFRILSGLDKQPEINKIRCNKKEVMPHKRMGRKWNKNNKVRNNHLVSCTTQKKNAVFRVGCKVNTSPQCVTVPKEGFFKKSPPETTLRGASLLCPLFFPFHFYIA